MALKGLATATGILKVVQLQRNLQCQRESRHEQFWLLAIAFKIVEFQAKFTLAKVGMALKGLATAAGI